MEEIIEMNFPTKNKRRAERRHNSVTKAIRKRGITRNVYGMTNHEWYNNLHQYNKNKIHCSCWMCSFHGWAPSYARADAKYKFDMNEYKAS